MAQKPNPPTHSPSLGKPVSQSLLARALQGMRHVISGSNATIPGADTTWMGPGQPLAPVAQEVAGRQFDFPLTANTNSRPRAEEAVGFEQMRALADNCDILRLVIETRKDQMGRQQWSIKPKDAKAKPDDRCLAIQEALQRPDGEHDWNTWLRMLLEEAMVTDAATLLPRQTLGGQFYGLEQIDGTTIKRLINPDGRTPLPPAPAYQQFLKGVPAADFTRDELLYLPRNQRVHKLYGFSPVEQVIVTVNIALRRQAEQLQFYTKGNIPNLIFEAPINWTAEQIAVFQANWDLLTSGESKHRGFFVPNGAKPFNTKEAQLSDQFDEWLARIICYCFSVPPTPFIKQMNRATAETAEDAAQEEGLEPWKEWIKGFMNWIVLPRYFNAPDLMFDFGSEAVLSPETQAAILDKYVRNGIYSIDEARQELNMEPVGFPNAIISTSGAVTLEEILNPPEQPAGPVEPGSPNNENQPSSDSTTPDGKGKAEKIAKMSPPPDDGNLTPDQDPGEEARNYLAKKFKSTFKNTAKDIAGQVTDQLAQNQGTNSGTISPELAAEMAAAAVAKIDFSAWDVLIDPTAEELEAAMKAAGIDALVEIGIEDSTPSLLTGQAQDLLNLPFPEAEKYAQERSAELVGKRKMPDGTVIDNPSAKWAITETTRDMIKGQVEQAIIDGTSMDTLAKQLEDSHAFSAARAMTIARTEVAKATSQGAMQGYRLAKSEYGVQVRKRWVTADDDKVDKGACVPNGEAGAIDLDAAFPSGDDAPPAHPNCRCAIAPVIGEEGGE